MNDCINEVRELEMLFSDNQYNGSGLRDFFIEEGTIPVIVSAPHAVNHYRKDRIKQADMYTGGIARYLHQVTGCHLICSSKFSQSDPNYDPIENNRYQEALRAYLEKHEIKVLLDIHGAAGKREYAVEMGTAPEQNPVPGVGYESDPSLHQYKFIDEMIKEILENSFKNLPTEKNKVWKNRIFDAGTQNTITRFISENTDTACIQLEINRYYREPENKEAFISLVGGLEKIIMALSSIDKG